MKFEEEEGEEEYGASLPCWNMLQKPERQCT